MGIKELVLIIIGISLLILFILGLIFAIAAMIGMRLRPFKFGREQEDEAEEKWLASLKDKKNIKIT